jgi:hypothetical protein
VELNEYWSIRLIGKFTIERRPRRDWTSFRSPCYLIHHILATSHLATSPLLIGARTQCQVNDCKHQKLFDCSYRIYAPIWISARISQWTADESQNLNNWSTWLGKIIITMPLLFRSSSIEVPVVTYWQIFSDVRLFRVFAIL